MAEPESVQRQEQVHFAEAELDVSTLRAFVPAQQSVVAQIVWLLIRTEHAELVDPSAEIRADADIGRHRDHSLGNFGYRTETSQESTKNFLGRNWFFADCQTDFMRYFEQWSVGQFFVVDVATYGATNTIFFAVASELIPFGVKCQTVALAQIVDLRL